MSSALIAVVFDTLLNGLDALNRAVATAEADRQEEMATRTAEVMAIKVWAPV